MFAQVQDVAYHVPDIVFDNQKLSEIFPDLTPAKIEKNTGIRERRVVSEGVCASDLAVEAARQLFIQGSCRPQDIDYLLFCTQLPDYFLPTTACLLQDRLGIPVQSGAFDFSLGCSGYVAGLGLAKALVETGQATNVLLLTADTLTAYVNPGDRSVRTLFGDGAAATLVSASRAANGPAPIGPFVYGSDGSGARHLMVPAGGCRLPKSAETAVAKEGEAGNVRSDEDLYMNGAEVFTFTLREVPTAVDSLLAKAGLRKDQIDHFVFHQANRYILDFLRKKLGIPEEKFPICIEQFGNTSSSTIPITIAESVRVGRIRSGDRLLLLGFGVGLSWAGTIITWP